MKTGKKTLSLLAVGAVALPLCAAGPATASGRTAEMTVGCVNCGAFHYGGGRASPEEFAAEWKRMAGDWPQDVFFYEDVGKGTPGNVSRPRFDIRASARDTPDAVDIVDLPQSIETGQGTQKTRRCHALRLTYRRNGGLLAVYGVHLVAESHIRGPKPAKGGKSLSQTLRQDQFKALIEDAGRFDFAILTGDFNAQKAWEYDVFREAGFTIANCSDAYGTKATLRDIPADNIILSPGLSFSGFKVLDGYVLDTDHLPLVASVRFSPASSGTVAAAFRPPAVPLVSVDPHFSVWSAADRLYDVDTTHWTGTKQPLSIFLDADGVIYRLCGRGKRPELELPVLPQISCRVGATTTSYRFSDGKGLSAEVDFATPRMTDDLDVFSRPVTYVSVRVKGAKKSAVRASISGAWATNDDRARMAWATNTVAGVQDVSVGRVEQTLFSVRGDRKRADWGRAHIVGPIAESEDLPVRTVRFLLAYDRGKSVRFFGSELPEWWARDGKPFEKMLAEAIADAPAIEAKCQAFDAEFRRRMESVGGAQYADIAELSWRQSFAACSFVAAADGEPFLFSAENGSGGMIGTTDVFYPQFPHLLYCGPTLAKASLAPTCIYAASTNWPYSYAPHDLGLFPVAEGQYYGMKKGQAAAGDDHTFRMPVEECGNMLILLAAVAKAEGNAGFASRWWDEVSKWAGYLAEFGYDPGSQLCTDDFAGHLAHNANLSVKSIVALGAYALMADMRGDGTVAAKYRQLAESMVPKWMEAAKGGAYGGTKIAFDRPGTWSIKYNLVWDRVLGLGLFPPETAEAELGAYRAAALKYGVPLDCRKRYTKADWILWAGALTGRREDLEFMCEGLHRFLRETPDRIPFGDWYMADSALYIHFIARSVVGGAMMPALISAGLDSRSRFPRDFGIMSSDGKGTGGKQ